MFRLRPVIVNCIEVGTLYLLVMFEEVDRNEPPPSPGEIQAQPELLFRLYELYVEMMDRTREDLLSLFTDDAEREELLAVHVTLSWPEFRESFSQMTDEQRIKARDLICNDEWQIQFEELLDTHIPRRAA